MKCIKDGCTRNARPGSNYCAEHKPRRVARLKRRVARKTPKRKPARRR